MSLSDTITTTMPVAPTGQGTSCGGWGDSGAWWIIILFLFVFCGWGNRGFGGGADASQGGGGASYGLYNIDRKLDGLSNGLCDGFYAQNTNMLNGFGGINQSISGASAGITQTLTQGFSGLNQSITNGFSQAELARCNQSANLTNQLNSMAMANQQCCCDTREAIQGVNYNLATQACGITNSINTSTRDIVDNANANTRAILDYLCQDKISTLQAENQGLRLAASQQAQNATLTAAMSKNTSEILARTAPYPIPAYQVPNPYAGCGYASCGCGCS